LPATTHLALGGYYLRRLEHRCPVVREAAVYGLARLAVLNDAEVAEKLSRASDDPCEIVRHAADAVVRRPPRRFVPVTSVP
jgi:HEAT repeat protein